jgi:hypothetical protein
MFENGVLRKLFDPKREAVAGAWRKLNITQLHGFYNSLNIICMIKLRKKRRIEHATRM